MSKHNQTITQQINDYVRANQQVMKFQARTTDIKKADSTRQDASAFNTAVINLTKVYQLNQLTLEAN